MEQIAQQLPLLAGFLGINGVLLKIIRDLYERMIKAAEKREEQAILLAKDLSRVIEAQTERLERLEEVIRKDQHR